MVPSGLVSLILLSRVKQHRTSFLCSPVEEGTLRKIWKLLFQDTITSPKMLIQYNLENIGFSGAISESHSGCYFPIIAPLVPGPQLIVARATSYVCPGGNYSGFHSVNK
jgi:hypothetical protein